MQVRPADLPFVGVAPVDAPTSGEAPGAGLGATYATPFAPLDPSRLPYDATQPLGSNVAGVMLSTRSATAMTFEVGPYEDIGSIYADLMVAGLGLDRAAFEARVRFQHPGIDLNALSPGQVLCFAPISTPRGPTQSELLASPMVRRALEDAWHDSCAHDPVERHEEGGWIYMNVQSGEVFTHRATRGAVATIDLSLPVAYADAVVVGTFHTHPHPSHEGWDLGPSDSDIEMELSRGTPGLIRNDQGYFSYGWSHRQSLAGPWAYPGTAERPL